MQKKQTDTASKLLLWCCVLSMVDVTLYQENNWFNWLQSQTQKSLVLQNTKIASQMQAKIEIKCFVYLLNSRKKEEQPVILRDLIKVICWVSVSIDESEQVRADRDGCHLLWKKIKKRCLVYFASWLVRTAVQRTNEVRTLNQACPQRNSFQSISVFPSLVWETLERQCRYSRQHRQRE